MPIMLFSEERRRQITSLLAQKQRVTVNDLSCQFGVSEPTIRKDLAHLEQQGVLMRTHGGAILAIPGAGDPGFALREQLQQVEKERIGAAAAALVQDGDSIALDASTTALCVARHLKDRNEVTVVTNGLRIALELADSPGVHVMIPGGSLRKESLSVVGTWGEPSLQQINIHKAFLGAKGFTLTEGLTDVSNDEVKLKQAFARAAKRVIAIVDASKWGQIALATICRLDAIDLIITDARAPQEMVREIRATGTKIDLV